MFNYLTEEQMNLISDVRDNHEAEFRLWADENESRLMKWYDDKESMGYTETALKFAHYCATEFIKWKSDNN